MNLSLILSCVGTFILTTAFNALGGTGVGVPDVFYATVGDISDKYELFITPAGRELSPCFVLTLLDRKIVLIDGLMLQKDNIMTIFEHWWRYFPLFVRLNFLQE